MQLLMFYLLPKAKIRVVELSWHFLRIASQRGSIYFHSKPRKHETSHLVLCPFRELKGIFKHLWGIKSCLTNGQTK